MRDAGFEVRERERERERESREAQTRWRCGESLREEGMER